MPRKGGGGQTPPEDAEEEAVWTNPERDRATPGGIDRAVHDEDELIYGDIVHDEEPADPEDRVVVNLPQKVANQWEVDGGTLADRNPACPATDDVIIVVLLEELNEYMPDWNQREEEIPLKQLEEDDVPYRAYPSMRLDRVGDSHLR